MNLSLCDISNLWTDVITTKPAKIISRRNQDFVCLLADLPSANNLTLNMNSLNCLDEIASLTVNQPPNGTFTINLKSGSSNRIAQLICNTSTTLNIVSPADETRFSTALISCDTLTISGPCYIKPFSISVNKNTTLTNISGSINSLNQSKKDINNTSLFNTVNLSDTNIFVGNIEINNSVFLNSSIRSTKTITLNDGDNDDFKNTLISGNIVNINNFNLFDLSVIADKTANISNSQNIIGLIDSPEINIVNAYVINGLQATKTQRMVIEMQGSLSNDQNNLPYDGRSRINQYLGPSDSIRIEGADNEDNSTVLTPSCSIVSPNILLDNFINYGTVVGERITLKNGINYGSIRGRFIANENTINNGTITNI
jgi:hypothetical protein